MKKTISVFLLIVVMLNVNVAHAVNTWSGTNNSTNNLGVWRIENYVDDFNQLTDIKYIVYGNKITGTFCNSAVRDRELKVELLVDENNNVALFLYEYGSQLVTSYSNITYDVTMRDRYGNDTQMTATLYKNGDRLLFSEKSVPKILETFRQGGKVSFFLENRKRTIETYLFTIPDTSGFDNAWNKMFGIIPGEDIEVTVKSGPVLLRNRKGGTLVSMPNGTVFTVTGYDPSCDMFTAVYKRTEGYIKGGGLNMTRDELLKHYQEE